MASPAQTQARSDILEVLRAYHEAMVEARTDLLDQLIAADFHLVHITGYRQPRQEWFGVILRREFDYHRIDVDTRSLEVNVASDSAMLAGRGIFNATINGMKHPWRLQFTMQLARRNGSWIVLSARYSTF